MRIVRVGLLKAIPKKWDKEANWNTMKNILTEASRRKIDIAVTPECFLDGYVVTDSLDRKIVNEEEWNRRFMDVAEDEKTGTYILELSNLAKELRIFIILGFTEKRDKRLFNAAYVFGRDGTIIGRYRKVNIAERERYTPGDSLPVFQTELGKIGVLICADRRWPENARALAVRGAEIIFVPSYGMWHGANTMWIRTRSYENGVYMCFVHPNLALITDPEGKNSAELRSNVEDILVHDVDLDRVKRNHIRERRPELYNVLCRNSQEICSPS